MNKVSDIFDISYGNSLELNKLKPDKDGINFVSRTALNNGVSGKVKAIQGINSFPAGTITVALSGSVMESFVQPEEFYTSFHIFCLTPKSTMSLQEKLYYCSCIRANKYRYNYGRQANRTLRNIDIPSKEEIPSWVNQTPEFDLEKYSVPINPISLDLNISRWKEFEYEEIFTLCKGKRLTKANMTQGSTPFIGSVDRNNGITHFIGQSPNHDGNTISVNYNGSVAEAFYQPVPFWACDDVNVLYPKFEMNQYVGMFIVAVIKKEKYRFNYGRKWHLGRMQQSKIKLPVNDSGELDLEFMERFIKSLPFSSTI